MTKRANSLMLFSIIFAYCDWGSAKFALAQDASGIESEQFDGAAKNVILITLDGVRLHEFLGEPDADRSNGDVAPTFPYLWNTLVPLGQIFGDPRQGQNMIVANTELMSLPGYQTIMTGTPERCGGNDCGRVSHETLPERLVVKEGMSKDSIAVLGSWENIAEAAEHLEGTATVNAGLAPFLDPISDPELQSLNLEQVANRPEWEGARFDRYTHRHAMRYLKVHHPKFMFVAYNDSDEWGHKVNYPMYLKTLRQYDTWLSEYVETLKSMGEYGKQTCLVVTTDHGRGDGAKWYTHSNGVPESGRILMYAGCPLANEPSPFRSDRNLATHLDIRPTIESLLNIAPTHCFFCGRTLVK